MPTFSLPFKRQRSSSTNTTSSPHHATTSTPTSMSRAFVSHGRRVRFDLHLRIIDLNNVPLVSGTSFVKWHLPSSTAAEHRGRTGKCAIHDHRVSYDYDRHLQVRLTVGKDGLLQECSVHFDVTQEYSAGHERIRLGDVKLNLAEYVDASATTPEVAGGPVGGSDGVGEEGVVRRYLMQESKINSTLKIGIHMRHLDGTKDYYAPPLRTAPVFGGIAGIISSSEPSNGGVGGGIGEAEDVGAPDPRGLPNLSAHRKELGEMQDMYRRTLAAFWASQPGELKADECIEEIFAGGDGWNKHGKALPGRQQRESVGGGEVEVDATTASGPPTPSADPEVQSRELRMVQKGRGMMTGRRFAGGGGEHHHHHRRISRHGDEDGRRKGRAEVDEFEVREDLKSWRIDDRVGRQL